MRSVMKTFNGSINDRDTDQALPAEALQKPIHPSMSTMRERTYNLSPRASSTREENIPHPGSDDHGRRFFFFFFFFVSFFFFFFFSFVFFFYFFYFLFSFLLRSNAANPPSFSTLGDGVICIYGIR